MNEIYDRFDPAKGYDSHLFRSDRILQSAEFNEIQSAQRHRLQAITDVLLKDGDIIRDAGLLVDPQTGVAKAEAGALYLNGAVRGIAPAQLQVAIVGTVTIGAYLVTSVVTELEDPALLNPAVGARGYMEPGAARMRMVAVWGVAGTRADEFYPVYTVVDGIVRQKMAPPNLDAVTQAISRYDRDSSGGSYVIEGLSVELLDTPTAGDKQTWLIAQGRARVNGQSVDLSTSRRITYDATPETRLISSEPHLITTVGRQRINVNRPAIALIETVQLTEEKTVTLTHGAFVGVHDALPDPAVIALVSVKQGGTTYTVNTDYKLGAAAVDWSPGGAEPATGSTYSVTYKHIKTAAPIEPDGAGFSVEGGVVGTLVLVTYRSKLPRIDRLCLDEGGAHVWIAGVAALDNPIAPMVPPYLLPLASVRQTWLKTTRSVSVDGARVVPMPELFRMQARIDDIYQRVAEQRLLSDASVRDSGIKRGIFVDPFIDDSLRDAGVVQSGSIVNGELVLPITNEQLMSASVSTGGLKQRCARVPALEIAQTALTGSMKINAYGSQLPMPAKATLNPALDRWTDTETKWSSPITQRLGVPASPYYWANGRTITTTEVVSTVASKPLETLRQIDIGFSLQGFGPGERLVKLTFDGIGVTPQPFLIANASGVLTGAFRIPAGVRTGRKTVMFTGESATWAEAVFTGEGTLESTTSQKITTHQADWDISFTDPRAAAQQTETGYPPGLSPADFPSIEAWLVNVRKYELRNPGTCVLDPLAQTFRVTRLCQPESVELKMVKRGGSRPLTVQIRETSNGVPTSAVLAESYHNVLPASSYLINAVFDNPPVLFPGIEYALVVLTDDMDHELAIAELGKYDTSTASWVSTQPYQIGVLLSSANAQTWTPHQDRDLWFRFNIAHYTETARTISLGHFTAANITDCRFMGSGRSVAQGATVEYQLTLPDATVVAVADGQYLQFAAPVTGNIAVQATVRATEFLSGELDHGTFLAGGTLATVGDYVSRAVTAGTNVRLRVVFDATLPAGSSVVAEYQKDGGAWLACANPTAVVTDGNALELSSINTGITAQNVRVRLTLHGTPAARPRVRNLRLVCTE
ncbi:MAG: DUF4815 domain-containing protein [Pseudomonas sp.]|uniref:DUF4815 domain-containing protein n=1 Tax=Pseudomonas sp. TaxID=306 RepID=UPI003390F806